MLHEKAEESPKRLSSKVSLVTTADIIIFNTYEDSDKEQS